MPEFAESHEGVEAAELKTVVKPEATRRIVDAKASLALMQSILKAT